MAIIVLLRQPSRNLKNVYEHIFIRKTIHSFGGEIRFYYVDYVQK